MIQSDMGNDSSRLLTPRAAAERLGVSYSTFKQWIYKGSVRTVQTRGGHHRIAEAEIERLLSAAGRMPKQRLTTRPFSGVLGIVEEVRVEGLLAQVRLRIGDQRLTAVITRDAIEALKLKRGQPALAVIKSTEVMIGLES